MVKKAICHEGCYAHNSRAQEDPVRATKMLNADHSILKILKQSKMVLNYLRYIKVCE